MSSSVYRRLRTKRDAAQAEMMFSRSAPRATPAHRHRATGSTLLPFSGAVSRSQNPAAHDGVCIVKTCACGATQRINCNGMHREHGPWQPAK